MRVTTAFLVLSLLSASCAGTEATRSTSVVVSSNYLGRGVVVHDGPVAQASLDAAFASEQGVLTTSIWANMDVSSEFDAFGSITELDLIADWTANAGPMTWSAGAIQYTFPHSGAALTTELYGSLQAAEWPLTPTLTAYWDFVEADGVYATLGGSHTLDLAEAWSLTLASSVGWMSSGMTGFNYGVSQDAFSDLYATASLAWTVDEVVGLNAGVAWASVLDSELRDAVEEADNATLTFGATVGF